jgi:hypothetical protein
VLFNGNFILPEGEPFVIFKLGMNFDGLVKSLFGRHPGESRGPERLDLTGFRLSPE